MTEVKGLRELQAALDQLPNKLQNNVMRGALRAGAKIIVAEAKRLAPVGPPSGEGARIYGGREGLLRDSIRAKSPENEGTKIVGGVTAGGKFAGTKKKSAGDAFYAGFVEFGTAAHVIRAKPGSLLALGVSKVNHPGAKKHPFLRPAFDSKATAAVEAMREYIRKRLATKYGIDVPEPSGAGDD